MNPIPEIKIRRLVFIVCASLLITISFLLILLILRLSEPKLPKSFIDFHRNQLNEKELQLLSDSVEKNDSRKIVKILQENEEIIKHSFSGNKFYSILHYAINLQNFDAAEALLKSGYNPNVQDKDFKTPLYLAVDAETLYVMCKKKTVNETGFINLLLKYKASPDICDDKARSPLINSIFYLYAFDVEKFSVPKILIEQGNCNIDFLDSFGHSATYYSLEKGYINLAYYLIVEKKANITNEDSMAILLRYLVFPLDSNEYRLKKQIIQEFKNHSIDYYSKPVPDDVLEMIKNIYPDNWKEYISVY